TEEAIADLNVRDLVERIINTGAEYEKTSDKYSHGIRSTPTIIINNRMIIGTLPYQHMKAIFQALVDERESGGRKFIENWVPPARRKK
ncbi:MAG: DsbA family protein, partial [Candidatus Aminicenantales bacterium]